MGKITNPLRDKKIIGRVMEKEGDYMRVLDLLEEDGQRELRFFHYYRKAGGKDTDWILGRGAVHLKIETFFKLIRKAKTKADYGTFDDVFKNL